MARRRPLPDHQLQLDFDAVSPARALLTAEQFLQALRRRRVRAIEQVRFKPNRARIITLSRDGRTLHIHACFEEAPDSVLDAVASFLQAGRRSHAYRDAIGELREYWTEKAQSGGWAAEEDHGVLAAVRQLRCCASPEQSAFLRTAYQRLNTVYFNDWLPRDVLIRSSDKMESRFGHMRYHTMRDGARIVLEIAVNHNLFMAGHEANLLDTLLHEMTHVEAWLEHGHRAHGAQWKRIARRVGCEARACSTRIIRKRRRTAGPLTRVPPLSWLPPLPARGAA